MFSPKYKLNVVMIIPTGLGCSIGGHAGDASPTAKLLASCCSTLLLHPNVVNGSDINEIPYNGLYIEGSLLDMFLEGTIELTEPKQNRVLLVTNSPVKNETVNAFNAARATIGLTGEIAELRKPLLMEGYYNHEGKAIGSVEGWEELVAQVQNYDFDALAIATPIKVANEVALRYFRVGGVNPWGGIEAKTSRLIAGALQMPVAHAPVDDKEDKDVSPERLQFNEIVDPRLAAEIVSIAYLHCVLKGLHMAPRIGPGMSVEDIDVLVSPYGCWGRPHYACIEAGIPIIIVRENSTIYPTCKEYDLLRPCDVIVENYWEAAGILMAMQAGIDRHSVRRPLQEARLYKV